MKKPYLLCFNLTLLLLSSLAQADPQKRLWAVTGYSTYLTGASLDEVVTGKAVYDFDYQLFALAISKIIPVEDDDYDFEWEVQLAKHTKGQDHIEFNGLYAVRWYPFPWDNRLDTDFAAGIGLSYASKESPFEADNNDDNRAEKLLGYILLEAEFQPKHWDNIGIVVRSHHRSGAWGLFNGIKGAYNSLGLGIKYRY